MNYLTNLDSMKPKGKFTSDMVELLDQPYKCDYCNRKFIGERTLINHMCEPKRRILQKNEKRVQAGFVAFTKFFKMFSPKAKEKTYEDFCDSPYYNAFVKFGSHITNLKVLYPDNFINYLITKNVKLDHWCKDNIYEEYLVDILKNESAESALERTIKTMEKWASDNNAHFEHYFLYATSNRVTNDILYGNVSCWVVLNTDSGKSMIQKLSDEQLMIISNILDIKYWLKKFKEQPADCQLIVEVCKELKIK